MNTLLKQICKQRDAAHFQSPVDAEKLKVRSMAARPDALPRCTPR
jgi:hypothetical protein